MLLLAALTLYAYHPFFSAFNLGAADAQYYQYMLHDAIIQLENGFFPPFVGQSMFMPNGTLGIMAPYYLFLGQLLNVLSFGTLNTLVIQHLTIFVSALSGALLAYFVIRSMAHSLRWQAVFLAFAYISCPGVMSLIFSMDMYFSYMAAPFIPAVFLGLIRIYETDDALAYVITTTALAMLWLSHPPIALWTSMLSFVFCVAVIVLKRRSPVRYVLMALLFGLLCVWQFLPIFSLGLSSTDVLWVDKSISRPDFVIEQLLQPIPDAFLPLGMGKHGLFFLQLGYALWFVVILAAITALRVTSPLLLRLIVGLIAVILLFLYPLPGIGRFLWTSMPSVVLDITNIYPNQRLYIILAGLACLAGALALQKIADSHRKEAKAFVAVALAILFAWNLYQIDFFVKHGTAVRSGNESTMSPKDSWGRAYNVYNFGWGLPKEYSRDLFWGTGAYWLKSRLLDSLQAPVDAYDNEKFAINSCLETADTQDVISRDKNVALPSEVLLKEPLSIATLNLRPNVHYLLCADMSASDGDALFQLLDSRSREIVSLEVPGSYKAPVARRQIAFPFYYAADVGNDVADDSYNFRVWSRQQPLLKLHKIGVMRFDPTSLPIRVESYTPYKARMVTRPEHKYLEVRKLFTPGYVALVNDEATTIIESGTKTILIPIKRSGANTIELSYIGTTAMRVSFYISAISWFLAIAFLLRHLLPHLKTLNKWKPDSARKDSAGLR